MKTPIVEIQLEAGYEQALHGLSLNKRQPIEKMHHVAYRLSPRDDAHNKFLESMAVWMLVRLPIHIWQQIDTYRAPLDGDGGFEPSGITKQSESTMHTATKRLLTHDDFDESIPMSYLNHLNGLVARKKLPELRNALPMGFLQTRMIKTNYKALRLIMLQRYNHKMPHWRQFCLECVGQLKYKEFLEDVIELLGLTR